MLGSLQLTPAYVGRWSVARCLGVGIVLSAALCLPRLAFGTCPPFESQSSMAKFQEALARHKPRSGRLSGTELVDLWKRGEITLPPATIVPPSGPAPLTVRIVWWWLPVDNPAEVEFDADGDGIPEILDRQYGAKREYTYQQPGRFKAIVRVHDRRGAVVTQSMTVTVMPFSTFDADLQSRWATMKASLRRGDIVAALECIHSKARSEFREDFQAFFRRLPDLAKDLTPIRFVRHDGNQAIYEMLSTEGGKTFSYQVLFETDEDGIWRVQGF